mmetsp:Transcript_49412/g.56918  ORF Transcript_49412/g.56918 Transcript_49412/m.56918 type:complete len:178 (+) Transcript_49412:3-536(+)
MGYNACASKTIEISNSNKISSLSTNHLNDAVAESMLRKNKPNTKKATIVLSQKVKTELCKTHSLGIVCPYGKSCSFAHGMSELKSKTQISSLYKTAECREFHGNGFCKFGARCQFIHHAPSEKRPRRLEKFSYQRVLATFEQATILKPQDSIDKLIMKNLNLPAYRISKLRVFQEMH